MKGTSLMQTAAAAGARMVDDVIHLRCCL